jgi:hypothetical protein
MSQSLAGPRINPSASSDVVGIANEAGRIGVIGNNFGNKAFGFLAGNDLVFDQHAGVYGESDQQGVMGLSTSASGTGVYGGNTDKNTPHGIGVRGETVNGVGVKGVSFGNGVGVKGDSAQNDGIVGTAHTGKASGVVGSNDSSDLTGGSFGVHGSSNTGVGVHGESAQFHGVAGAGHGSDKNGGVGVLGANDSGGVGVFGSSPTGIGVLGIGPVAGRFEGEVEVTGNLKTVGSVTASDIFLVNGADCAEDFDIAGTAQIDPGTVMVIDQEGALQQSQQAYDKRVAGVVSGAGDLRPGIVLNSQKSRGNRLPIALVGKVYCKVDAQYAPVEVGDLLTTSPTPGFAMKADSPLNAFGAVIGKALRRLESGQALIPVLVALQ